MEQFAVTAATGALGPVLLKLTALLGAEYKLQEGTLQDIMSIKSRLEPVHQLLPKLWGREDLDVACVDWMAEARELSYDMEDGIDRFIALDLKHGDDGILIQLETTNSPFEEFMARFKGVASSKRCRKMQTIADTIIPSKLTTDPRALFLHNDASELVGMQEKEEKLIRLLQEHQVVCIFGFAGMGKTTLADLVYHRIGDQFQCRAFVSVHPSPDMMEILGTIRSQVTSAGASAAAGSGTEPEAEQNIINDMSFFLSDKRYLVIIDDIWHWEEWEVIRKALPKNNLGSKIVMTTRAKALADKCQAEQGAHVYTQSFHQEDAERLSYMKQDAERLSYMKRYNKSVRIGIYEASVNQLSREVVEMSGLMPLAVICLSSAWAESRGDWDTWVREVLMDRFLSTPSLKPLVRSLCLVFDHLPVQLKTCLLYCSMYPLGYPIQRDCLVRKWIDEGFVSQQEVSEAYFDKLVSRNLLQPVPEYQSFYIVHPTVLAFLVCKAKKDNFVACGKQNNGRGSSSHAKQIRRLSIYTDHNDLDEDVSHTRSLAVLGLHPKLNDVRLKKFKHLRVLQIDRGNYLGYGHLIDICGLLWLRCLDLNGCTEIEEIPREIGRLQNLETLEVRSTGISNVPTEIGELEHLRTLNVSDTRVTELPREITRLSRLENLDLSSTGVKELPNELGKLQQLRTLDIRVTKIRELSCREVPNSFLSVVGHFDSSSGRVVKLPLGAFSTGGGDEEAVSSSGANCREGLSILVRFNHLCKRCEVLPVPMHRVAGRHLNVPQWVKQDLNNSSVSALDISLFKLREDDLDFLKGMPNLQALALRIEVQPRQLISITSRGFSKLETFYVDSRLPWVTFKHGAMPKLKHLEFKFYTGAAAGQHCSMGIAHLPSLDKVVFRCSEHYTSDSPGISAAIEAVRKEAVEHPNEITLYVNGTRPEVFGSGATWISQAEKAVAEKELEERERIREKRELLLRAAERRRYNN